jgi:sugar phosphate isomerase/epimerase
MKISVSSYSFSQYIRAGKMKFVETVKKAHDIGFKAIEFSSFPQDSTDKKQLAEELRSEAEKYNMEIPCYAVGANMVLETCEDDGAEYERVCREIDIAKILGAKLFRHDATFKLPTWCKSFYQALPKLAENIRRITEYGEKQGIRTMVENHGFICQDSIRVEQLFAAVNHKNFGILLDMGNFMCVDENCALAVSRCAPYAFHVHAKDFYFLPFDTDENTEGCIKTRACNYLKGSVISEGVVPVKQCLSILARAGYEGYLGIEFEGSEDCIEGISKGLHNLTQFVDEVVQNA